jgi:hypothetical protein
MNQNISQMLLAVLLIGVAAFGQVLRYRTADEVRLPGNHRAGLSYAETEKRFAGAAFDEQARTLLQASEAFTKKVFRLPTLRLERAVTYRDTRGDILAVEWRFEEPFGRGSILAEDTPYTSDYSLRLSDCKIVTRNDLTTFLTSLLIWGRPPVTAEVLMVDPPEESPRLDRFTANQNRSPYFMLHDYDLGGVAVGNEWDVRLRLGKSHTRGFYPVPPFIPERFPALTDLVKTWTGAQIRAELGKPVGPSPQYVVSHHRNVVLMTELARRGLTREEVIELVVSARPANSTEWVSEVLGALRAAGNQIPVSSFIGPAMEMYRRIGSQADRAVEALFDHAKRSCAPASEQEAIKALREGVFVQGPRTYLAVCASSEEALAAVAASPETRRNPRDKEGAMESIRQRMQNRQRR